MPTDHAKYQQDMDRQRRERQLAGPLPCHWYENPGHPGERFLVPCCPERAQDMDAACTCEFPIEELARLREEVPRLRAELDATRRSYHILHGAVLASQDATAIYGRATEHERQLREVR
jgi:hypothetical protein